MTASAASYGHSAEDLDRHLAHCQICGSGRSCADGDQIAETEYRAFRAWQRDDPDAARSAQYRRSA